MKELSKRVSNCKIFVSLFLKVVTKLILTKLKELLLTKCTMFNLIRFDLVGNNIINLKVLFDIYIRIDI